MENPLKIFSLQFFKELGANIIDCGDYLEVTDVPVKFQKFYGKNEPYKIVFDKSFSNVENEIVTAESYMLKMMRAYLDNSGDAVLLSLNYRLYVDDGSVVDPDLSKFTTTNLNKKDIEITELRDYYSIAKDNIKESINVRTSKIAEVLEKSLSKEVSRIDIYYEQQVKEIDVQIAKISSSSSKLKDPAELEKLKTQFSNEKELFIQNEQKKHTLKLNTKLINTTIIDYPVYSLEIFFKSGNVTRLVIVNFDPLKNSIELPLCDLCKNPLKEIILCNGSHLVCRNCGAKCQDCNSISCELCLKNLCSVTKRKICKQCGRTCVRCKAFKNKRFMVSDSLGRSFVCKEC